MGQEAPRLRAYQSLVITLSSHCADLLIYITELTAQGQKICHVGPDSSLKLLNARSETTKC